MPKSYSIVGTQFTGTPKSFLAGLQPGTAAVLIREPTNKYDGNAVAVWIEGRRVGYIPKAQNVTLAQYIDQAGVGQVDGGALMAMDQNATRAITAKFTRSPNSGFPMVEV